MRWRLWGWKKLQARTTELAVRRFEAEVLKNRPTVLCAAKYYWNRKQDGNFWWSFSATHPTETPAALTIYLPTIVNVGVPSQLLDNRPDIRQAQLQLAATRLDVKSTRANFYPALRITGAIGYQAFNPAFWWNHNPCSIHWRAIWWRLWWTEMPSKPCI